ncbi:FAD-dependent oxidoreductase [Sphaerisporangium sp. TRM90804]|uniref:FAD-dependent oxidoreductase n=1 Tax=Sphaerisporangium sp. TRM90804 TaxID=3031113 RepID=UPI00244AC6B1|nr:FAD-dependent oxidoreductase [Sphaerisporangium sp. TRM90804]MDH2430152.1 FAD-dependent oxidoreductase [Sphaerisporangium sp. TRM90804]
MRVVIAGGGMAGTRLAAEIRQRDADVAVTVFGTETRRPYNRVLLSNVLAGTASADQVCLPAPGGGVTARLGVTVTAVDRASRTVRTSAGDVEPYDVLVLATGSEPVVPPIPGAARAIAFRTMDDCDRIIAAAANTPGAVVVGGGLLGVEAARGLAGRGLHVTLLHHGAHLMERQLDAEAGLVLEEALTALGVTVRTGVRVSAIHPHGAELSTGELLESGLVVLACGVRPVVGLARDAGLPVDRGIIVDDHMRTADPAIYAIGECAQHDGTVYGLVAPAWEQAAVVADLVTGAVPEARYRGSRLVTRLKARSIELAAMGETHLTDDPGDAGGAVEVVCFSHRARGIYRKLVIRNDRLVGAILLGEAPTVGTLTQLYDRGAHLPGDPAGLLFNGLDAATPADSPLRMPDSARVCECNNVTKGRIRACWEKGARDAAAVVAATRATTGCGTCRDAVEGLVEWLSQQEEVRA